MRGYHRNPERDDTIIGLLVAVVTVVAFWLA